MTDKKQTPENYVRDLLSKDREKILEQERLRNEALLQHWGVEQKKDEPQDLNEACSCDAKEKEEVEDEQEELDEGKEKKFKRPTSGPNWKSAGAPIDREEYPEIKGLEGPFKFKSGILYYDPKEGKYYNSKTDMYLDELPESCDDLNEVAPPDKKIEKWLRKGKVKSAFKDRYGEDKYKQVMYGRAWNLFNKKESEKEGKKDE